MIFCRAACLCFMKHESRQLVHITSTSRYALRNSDFTIPRFNTINYGKHTIRYLGPTIWTKLSEDLRRSKNLKIFKTCIRKVNLSDITSDNCKN